MTVQNKYPRTALFLLVLMGLLSLCILFDKAIFGLFASNDFALSQFDRALYYCLLAFICLMLISIFFADNSEKKEGLQKILPGIFCFTIPFLFQLLILRYQNLYLWDDAGHYVSIGMNLFSGNGFTSSLSGAMGGAYFPSLPYPVFQYGHFLPSILFGLFWQIFHSLKGIILSVVLIQSVNCFLIYQIARRFFKNYFMPVSLCFLYFSIVLYSLPQRESLQPLYDHPFTFLVFLSVILMNEKFPGKRRAFFLGLLLSLGILIKTLSLFVFMAFVLTMILFRNTPLRTRFKTAGFSVLGFLTFMVPYQFVSLVSQGEFFPSKYTTPFYTLDQVLKEPRSTASKRKHSLQIGKNGFVHAGFFPFLPKKNAQIPLEMPELLSPKDDAVVSLRPVFRWTKVPRASSYEGEITTDGGAKIRTFHTKKTGAKMESDLPQTRLRWRIRARRVEETSEWSPWAFFTPKESLVPPEVIWPLGDEGAKIRPILQWGGVAGATSYEVELTTDGGREEKKFTTRKTSKQFRSDLPATRLRWRVRARQDKKLGPWSQWSYFTPIMPSYRHGSYYFAKFSPYLVIMGLAVLLYIVFIFTKREKTPHFLLLFSAVYILFYSFSLFWAKNYQIIRIRHFFAPITLSFLVLLYVLTQITFREKKIPQKHRPFLKWLVKSSILSLLVFLFLTGALWTIVRKNCRFIAQNWESKNEIIGGREAIDITELIEWIKTNTGKNELLSFQYDNIGEIHVLTGRPTVILPRKRENEYIFATMIRFFRYYRPKYLFLHTENLPDQPLQFNSTLKQVCEELNYSPLEIVTRHKIWVLN